MVNVPQPAPAVKPVTFTPAAIQAAQLALAIAAEPISASRRRPRYGLDVSPSPCPVCNRPLLNTFAGWACGCRKGGAGCVK